MKLNSTYKKRLLRGLLILVAFIAVFVITEVILANVYLAKIETQVRQEATSRINGQVELGEFKINIFSHFPNVSLTVRNVKIQDNYFDISKKPLLNAESINIQVKFFKLIQNQIEIKQITIIKGNINMQRMPSGQWNTYNLVKPKSEPTADIVINNVALEQIHIISKDTVLVNNNFDFIVTKSEIGLSYNANGVSFVTDDRIYSNGIAFRVERGPCFTSTKLRTTLKANWNKNSKTLSIEPSTLYIGKNKAYLEGKIKIADSTAVNLVFTTKKVEMATAIAMLSKYTGDKLKPFNFSKSFPVILKLSGIVKPNRPLDIDIYFKTNKNVFTSKGQTFTDVAFSGHYKNHLNENLLNEESNSGLFISGFTGKYEGIPLSISMDVFNMLTPYINMKLSCSTDLNKLNNAIDTSSINFTKGKIELKINYLGYPSTPEGTSINVSGPVVNGYAKLIDAAYNIPNRKYNFSNITGTIFFNKHDIYFNEIPITINKNFTYVSGEFKNVSKSLFNKNVKTTADISIKTDLFSLGNFSPPEKRTLVPQPKNEISEILENLLTNIDVNISLKATKITYKQLSLNQVKVEATMDDNTIYCKKASFNAANGAVNFFGAIVGIGTGNRSFSLTADIHNADISKLFQQLNNFNQDAVTAKNIQGTLTAQIKFSGNLSKTFAIQQSSMNGEFDINVKQGGIRNMTALNEITKNIFKNKQFSDIDFAELNHKSRLAGYDLYVDQMEIQSNILTLFVNGIYSLKDNTELFIKIPISSLKQQDADYIAENNEPDEKMGICINLKATKKANEFKVVPILFKRNSKK